ncbi:hypothetical protein KQI41_10810 [Tissierella pigra]|uniref:Uncharacterized protein n=1 Tax=Tissierella pigra TaxID=2607614 RepID=A0A6N7Y3B6_9FIRM|nr:hypothetical protein [Tissierella pigra]MBU5426901.1 hypothetical protein [Tissierella pigra]MSU03285.1 hypothetical protein [Tissierella pigra]
MKKKLTALLIVALVITVFAPISAMAAYDEDSVDAGKYGTLWGYNYGWIIETTIDYNDGTGRLVNGYEVRDNDTGRLYAQGSERSSYGEGFLQTLTDGDFYYGSAVYGSHEVRGSRSAVAYTVTLY